MWALSWSGLAPFRCDSAGLHAFPRTSARCGSVCPAGHTVDATPSLPLGEQKQSSEAERAGNESTRLRIDFGPCSDKGHQGPEKERCWAPSPAVSARAPGVPMSAAKRPQEPSKASQACFLCSAASVSQLPPTQMLLEPC